VNTDTKPTKAIVAAVLTLLGLVGVTVTDGTTQLVTAAVQLLLVTYGVWRAHNAPRRPRHRGVGDFLHDRGPGGDLR
jgi:hypothetical protein